MIAKAIPLNATLHVREPSDYGLALRLADQLKADPV